ncbi:MAG: hypothetical protein B7X04_02125 [Parcubacteria group bacterium 21-54-25]|nr:MAG: hypothetical protein B7X04_02125 [Parcubacteria group bacterium 21-54-25]
MHTQRKRAALQSFETGFVEMMAAFGFVLNLKLTTEHLWVWNIWSCAVYYTSIVIWVIVSLWLLRPYSKILK